MRHHLVIAFSLFLFILPVHIAAQTTADPNQSSYSLKGRHSLDLSLGLLSSMSSSAEVTFGGVNTSSSGNGFLGSVNYAYWLEDEVALSIHVGVQNADAKTSVSGLNVSTESVVVIPLLFGVKYQVFRLTDSNSLRPYLSVSVGPYIGTASNVHTGMNVAAENITETAVGSRLALDNDWLLSKRFKLGMGIGYRLVSDFSRRIGSKKNYSSPEFSLCVGIIIGKGKQ